MARYISSASAPPCVLGAFSKDKSEALVAMVDGVGQDDLLRTLGMRLLATATDYHMSALVADRANSCAFVVLVASMRSTTPAAGALKREIEQLPGAPKVEWVEPLTRRLQTRLGWGDVGLTELAQPALMDAADNEIVREGLPHTMYWEHPTRGRPFPVLDPPKPSDAEKLAWLRQELGGEAELIHFARKYMELFNTKVHTESVQKASVLRLYRVYAGTEYKRECDLPPALLSDFQQVWHPDAPSRCRECGKALTGNYPIERLYCNDACHRAGVGLTCRGCSRVLSGSPHCPACERGGVMSWREPREESERMLLKARRLWLCETNRDPEHEPAWKRRRRS